MARATALYMFLVAARSMSAHGAQFAPPPAFTTSAAARAFSAHAAAYGPPAASSYGELSSPRSFSAHAAAYVPPLVASRAIVGQALPPPGSAPGGPARLPRCRPMAYGALVALVGAGIYMALAPDDNEEDFPGSIRGCWSIKAASSERDSGLTLLAEMFGDPAHNFHCPFSGCSEVVYVFNLSPKDGNDTGGSSNMAIDHIINSAAKSNYMSAGQINVPIVFRGPNGAAAGVGAQHSQIDCEGKDVTITAFSKMVGYALQAAEILSKEGISAEVINLRSIRPLDRAAINASVRKTNRLVTLEEGFPQHGVGAEICMSVVEESFEYLDAPVERIAGADVPMPYAANLERLAVPQIEDIVRAARRACYRALPMAATA